MYLNFFNLKREPFNITPDPDLLYLSPSHKEALAAAIYGVTQRKGFVDIIGEVGVGKTTIIRSFLNKIDKQNVSTIYVFNSNISFKALLKTIYQNLGKVPQTDDVSEMVDRLHLILIDEYKEGRNVVLIIDEAQNMPVETLENLRMLSNLETSTDKLIQIVFCGQPEFEQKLNLHSLRQLNQRIAIRAKIAPLTRTEGLEYIKHRLRKSLVKDEDIFCSGALNRIIASAGGVPRVINILCDNCLVTAFGKQQKKVTSRVAREIIAEQRGCKEARLGWQIACFAAFVVAVMAFLLYVKSGRAVSVPVRGQAETGQSGRVADNSDARAAEPVPARAVGRQPERNVSKTDIGTFPTEELVDKAGSGGSRSLKVVKRGDTLARLVKETYGSVDRNLLKQVKRNNPTITNVDLIQVGERIYFPEKVK